MNYNIEFQIASIIFEITLMIVFFSKKRWASPANVVYRVLMILTLITLILDVASVITITEVIAGNEELVRLNNFLSKSYLIVMLAYIGTMDVYAIVNTMPTKATTTSLTLQYVGMIITALVFIVACGFVIANPLL